jgi:hypothetical protein
LKAYYLEYEGINGKTIHTEQIPLLKPGDTACFEYMDKAVTMVGIYRPNEFLAIEKGIVPIV